jgi:isoleucyl-tRNA synthetase
VSNQKKYKEFKGLDLPNIAKETLDFWNKNQIFEKSISSREGKTPWVFYEGPPSANGMPGIHHVMARTIKDIFCRYKTLQGYQVKRKAGWDTHGLPVELGVEKNLGITKEDIGSKITVEQYNVECRKDVMKFTDKWEELTSKMGYWVDMQNPYITYDNKYIESVWWLLGELHKKNLLYKGFTIQPYSPAAGTGLSSHELNQPGCYKDVKDRTATAQFKIKDEQFLSSLKQNGASDNCYILAWTTTPWTLPSNTALAVGKNIDYVVIKTFNQYDAKEITAILAKERLSAYLNIKGENAEWHFKAGDKIVPYQIINELKGEQLVGVSYEQLLPFTKPDGDAFRVISGDFVTTSDGTGIVHIAPTFGADDMRVAKESGIPLMLVKNEDGNSVPLVDLQGKFVKEVNDGIFLYGNEFVKEAYLTETEKQKEFEHQKKVLEAAGKIKELKVYLSVDERIVLKLQEDGKLFKKETYEHNYPHCWRTDKPVLYYPLDSWFIRTTSLKDRMIELNKTINWKPEATGTGRFGNWLENLNDWNLSRSRFWGIPIPIWTSEDKTEQIIISSVEQLQAEIKNAVAKGMMNENPLSQFVPGDMSSTNYDSFDLHKPYADNILLERNGKKLFREPDLIDVWFDSGAMPYAQLHYPFENKELIDGKKYYPADFIAEGVDQTRGWFFTLHAIATMCFDSVAYKNVVSNGLVLDKNGNKMSKRLGNAVDPFETLAKYGPDATRWYMIANAAPWDNLKFDIDGIAEVQRKLFGTLYNTYSFFALYANVDSYSVNENNSIPVEERSELDRWIISKLNSLVKDTTTNYEDFEPHRAARLIEDFVDEHLSNWYIRLSRRRFWKGEMSKDKQAAYETLFECLNVVSRLMSPIAPFFAEWLYKNLNDGIRENNSGAQNNFSVDSVHLSKFAQIHAAHIDTALEEKMEMAQKISSMILSIRKKENLRVRQPLSRIQIPVLDKEMQNKIAAVQELILSEVNVKQIEFVDETQTQIVKNLKLNFKTLGKKCGKHMKAVQLFAQANGIQIISGIEKTGKFEISIENESIILETEDVEIIPVDIPGWKVANQGALTVALDINLNEALINEGIARELVNRIQNIRKEKGFEVTDKINIEIQRNNQIETAIKNNLDYICNETLTNTLVFVEKINNFGIAVDVDETLSTFISVQKN